MMLGECKFKKAGKSYEVFYKGPMDEAPRSLCFIDRASEGGWVILFPREKLGPFKTLREAADAYLAYSIDPIVKSINEETERLWNTMPRGKSPEVTLSVAGWIYDIILANCLGHESLHEREVFVRIISDWGDEYRFCGWLGCGGKFHRTHNRWYVSQYPEDAIPETRLIEAEANNRLAKLYASLVSGT